MSVNLGGEDSGKAGYAHAYLNLAREMLLDSSQQQVRMEVQGNSMAPVLRPKDAVVVENKPGERFRRGDILLVARNDDYVTHRLIDIKPEGYILKGDNMFAPDKPVLEEQIIGKVIQVYRRNRRYDLTIFWRRMIAGMIGWLSMIQGRVYSHYRLKYDLLPAVVQQIIRPLMKALSFPLTIVRILTRL